MKRTLQVFAPSEHTRIMKEVVIHEGPRAELIESPIPKAKEGQVVIKVEVSGTNPKDWKTWWIPKLPVNMGDDFAGVVHEVGAGVTGFQPGDRVFALHEVQAPYGSFAEYAVAWAYTTCLLPTNTPFEEAATIPLAALTASLALYRNLELNTPWSPATNESPILIYGASTSVGSFAVKLCARSNLHPIIAIAGAGRSYVSALLETGKGDVLMDYRNGFEVLELEIKNALRGTHGLSFALDAISENGSSKLCANAMQSGGKLAHVLPLEEGVDLGDQKSASLVMVGDVHGSFGEDRNARDFGKKMMDYFGNGLEEGWFKGHPYEVVPGGLGSVGKILDNLKAGKASAKKYVFRLRET